MRNKKSKTILYVLVAVILLGIFFVASRDFTPATETVEQPLENNFAK